MHEKPDQLVIDRIVKLQALAEHSVHSDNPELRKAAENEAMMAMKKIAQILKEYNLSMSDVENMSFKAVEHEVTEGYVVNKDQLGKDKSKDAYFWYVKLGSAIGELCFCSTLFGAKGTSVHFIGMPTDVEVAKTLYSWMRDQVKILAEYAHSCLEGEEKYVSKRRYLDSWIQGCVDKIWQRVLLELRERQQDEGTTAIVIAKEPLIELYIKDKYPKLRSGERHKDSKFYDSAYKAGQQRGEQIPLYETPGVES